MLTPQSVFSSFAASEGWSNRSGMPLEQHFSVTVSCIGYTLQCYAVTEISVAIAFYVFINPFEGRQSFSVSGLRAAS